jgi:CheY-like chemotaxis protein
LQAISKSTPQIRGGLAETDGRLVGRDGGARDGTVPVFRTFVGWRSRATARRSSNKRRIRVRHEPEAADRVPRSVEHQRKNVPHILVVDDDPTVCMAIEAYLEKRNFRVTVADGGETGLRALEADKFDLMIVDIFMPHMRGFESIRIFHERAPTVPLIAMSGYAFANLTTPAPDFLRMTLELGASRCLRKPFTPVTLLTVINECLAEVEPRWLASS